MIWVAVICLALAAGAILSRNLDAIKAAHLPVFIGITVCATLLLSNGPIPRYYDAKYEPKDYHIILNKCEDVRMGDDHNAMLVMIEALPTIPERRRFAELCTVYLAGATAQKIKG